MNNKSTDETVNISQSQSSSVNSEVTQNAENKITNVVTSEKTIYQEGGRAANIHQSENTSVTNTSYNSEQSSQ